MWNRHLPVALVLLFSLAASAAPSYSAPRNGRGIAGSETLAPGNTPLTRKMAPTPSRAASARAITVDLSTGGFACLLAKAPSMGDEIGFSLRLPGTDALAGKVRVADVKPQQGNVRVSFQFVGVTAEERRLIIEIIADQTRGRVPILAGAAEANVKQYQELDRVVLQRHVDDPPLIGGHWFQRHRAPQIPGLSRHSLGQPAQ